MVRIAIADDDGLLCEGLRSILARSGDFAVVGWTGCAGVVDLVEEQRPDVLLLDSRMTEALEVCLRMREPGRPRTILFAVDGDEDWAVKALESGAWGILDHAACAATLEKAIHAVHEGQIWAQHSIVARVVGNAARERGRREGAQRSAQRSLSGREREVLVFAARGLGNKEIAGCLGISASTVKAHLTHVFQKLRLRDRVQLAAQYGGSAPETGPSPRTLPARRRVPD